MKKQDNVGIVNSIPESQLLTPWLDFIESKKKEKERVNKIGMLFAFSFDNLSHLITNKRLLCICCQN